MPIPIAIVNDMNVTQSIEQNYFLDYSVLTGLQTVPPKNAKTVTANNKDADLLYDLWTKASKVEQDVFNAESIMSSRDFMRLKTKGYVDGQSKSAKISSKGRSVICVMALDEPNNFAEKRENKPYTQILSNMSKKGKTGYRIACSPSFEPSSSNTIRLS